jgi:membrane fusion protein, multidrug efflux system
MKALPIVLAILACGAAGLWVYHDSNRQAPVTVSQPPAATPPVEVAQLPKTSVNDLADLEGRLEAGSETEIHAALSGYAVHFKAAVGDLVQKGQLLVELGDSKLAESVTRAETALQLAKTELQARRARVAQSEQDYRQQGELARKRATLVANREDFEAQMRTAKAEDDVEQARINQTQADLDRAKLALAATQVLSPITGYITERLPETAELSRPELTLMRVVDVTTMKMVIDIPEPRFRTIVPNQEAHVTVETLPGRYFVGAVARKGVGLNPATRSGGVSIEIDNPEKLLKPGMRASARMIFDRFNEAKIASLPKRNPASPAKQAPVVNTPAQPVPDVVSSLTALSATLGATAKELERKENAAKVTAEASKQYFASLERLIFELRDELKTSRSINLDKAAEKIDDMPILHVDDELLAFGGEVAKTLREMAEQKRIIARSGNSGDFSGWDQVQGAANAVRTQGIQRITNGLTDIRRRMTRKYDLEFLATASPPRSTTMRDARRARR